MRKIPVCILIVIGIRAFIVSGTVLAQGEPVTLVLEQDTTLHVGELAVLSIPSDPRYHRDTDPNAAISGAWREVLELISHTTKTITFRAIQSGPGVIILSPDVPNGECISCATLHYFVQVVPETETSIERLPPIAFTEMPKAFQQELRQRGCKIPQNAFLLTKQEETRPNNVIRGEFARTGQTDWAAFCSKNGRSSIVVF